MVTTNHTKACTTRPLVQACVVGGKLMTLPNFILNFKAKYLQHGEAGFERIKLAIHTKVRTTRPLVEACVVLGKLLDFNHFSTSF